MRHAAPWVALFSVLSLVSEGCAPPVVSVRHELAADLPVPVGARRVRVDAFRVAEGPANGYAAMAAEAVAKGLRRCGALEPASDGSADLTVGGTLHVGVDETRERRPVRRLNAETRRMEILDVDTLVRRAKVRVDFVVRDARGVQLAAVETHESYRSTEDPRTRGPLGLGRPDEAAYVPSAETIVRELLASCAGTLCRMMAPSEVTVELAMRPVKGSAAGAGLESARRGDYAAAREAFEGALADDPDNTALLFNLGVVAEASGDAAAALGWYEKAMIRSDEHDMEARQGVARLKRVVRPASEAGAAGG